MFPLPLRILVITATWNFQKATLHHCCGPIFIERPIELLVPFMCDPAGAALPLAGLLQAVKPVVLASLPFVMETATVASLAAWPLHSIISAAVPFIYLFAHKICNIQNSVKYI